VWCVFLEGDELLVHSPWVLVELSCALLKSLSLSLRYTRLCLPLSHSLVCLLLHVLFHVSLSLSLVSIFSLFASVYSFLDFYSTAFTDVFDFYYFSYQFLLASPLYVFFCCVSFSTCISVVCFCLCFLFLVCVFSSSSSSSSSCSACGQFVLAFPEESRSQLDALYELWFAHLSDNISSVRRNTAFALGSVIAAYKQEALDRVGGVLW
jgi:hypothetical protein